MHIPDGIVPASVAAAGYVAAAGVTWLSLRKVEAQHANPRDGIPKASLLTAVFFISSLVHIPVPPSSVHLMLGGLMGVVLGWYAFPAVLVGLFFQALMFQHGGLTTLGLNACIIGLPALLAHLVYHYGGRWSGSRPGIRAVLAFVSGSLAVATGSLIAATVIFFTVPAYLDATVEQAAITGFVVAHLPLAAIEGMFTSAVVVFLLKVKPTLLEEAV